MERGILEMLNMVDLDRGLKDKCVKLIHLKEATKLKENKPFTAFFKTLLGFRYFKQIRFFQKSLTFLSPVNFNFALLLSPIC